MTKKLFILLSLTACLLSAQIDPDQEVPESGPLYWPDDTAFETVGDSWRDMILADKGVTLMEDGRYEAAIDTFLAALDMMRDKGPDYEISALFDHIGRANQALGRFDQALNCYDSSLVYSRGFFEDRFGLGRTFNNIGSTLVEIGQYARALQVLDSALILSRELTDTAAQASTLNNIGNAYYGLKQFSRAAAVYDSARVAARSGKDPRTEGYILNNLGFTCAALKRYDRALVYYDSSRAMIEDIGDLYGSGVVLNNLGEALAALGRYDQSLAIYDSSLIKRRVIKNRYGEGITLKNIGQLHEARGEWEKALDDYRQAIEIKEKIRSELRNPDLAAAYGESEKDAYQLIIDLLIKHGREKEAFEYLGRSQSEVLREIFQASGIEAYDPSLKNELSRINGLETKMAELQSGLQNSKIGAEEYEKNQTGLDGQYNQALVDLKTYHSQVYDLLEPGKRSFEDIQAGIPDRVLYVQYVTAEDRYLAFLITRESFKTALLAERSQIDSLVENFRTALVLKEREIITGSLRKLYDLLIRPLEPAVEPAQDVVIIPYGPLHYLPFTALIRSGDDDGFEYFIETKRIRYLPSATFITGTDKKPVTRKANLCAFADADQTLPGAEEEVKALSRLYPHSAIFIKGEATKERFIAEAGNFGIVHLATHGRLDIDPRRSRIVLAPPGPGDLTCREVLGLCGLFKKNTALVTLSACETAVDLDREKSGRELTTMADAFKRAGVPSLVATLWPVADLSTAQLMKDFYQNLRDGKMDKLEALRQAQIKMIHGSAYPDPYYWAPFVLFGDAR
jgi:CHAT domain-containing protein/tetratricopeptide (TPR) repeat protein